MKLLYVSNVLGDRGFTTGIAENLSKKFSDFATVTIVSNKKNHVIGSLKKDYKYSFTKKLELLFL